ncbi:MAG: hypothetical protein V7L29_00935 [Nostoc sp.]|uniref:hypothetical protein n=1 Tax=Nostoc sp. TaxID=1180 RepID=UPI002FFBB8B5
MQPKFAAIENVTGLLTCPYRKGDERGYFRYILQQLSSGGYDADWLTIGSGHCTAPSLESGYCWLPSPGALSFSGKGRPPGQTKQEGGPPVSVSTEEKGRWRTRPP